MKADSRPDPGGGWERDGLRETLRHWAAPAAPLELESALRHEFRRRRPRRKLDVWLSLAAVVGLLAAWPIVAHRPKGAAPMLTTTAPPARLPSRLEPAAPRAAPAATVPRAVANRRVAKAKPPEPVVVETGQAELLAELGRTAWERTEARPAASLPSMAAGEAPAYRAEWEEVAGEWPAVQVVVSTSGR